MALTVAWSTVIRTMSFDAVLCPMLHPMYTRYIDDSTFWMTGVSDRATIRMALSPAKAKPVDRFILILVFGILRGRNGLAGRLLVHRVVVGGGVLDFGRVFQEFSRSEYHNRWVNAIKSYVCVLRNTIHFQNFSSIPPCNFFFDIQNDIVNAVSRKISCYRKKIVVGYSKNPIPNFP